jgi:hypothetical protein
MGQQQLLLIVLGLIIVGIAIAVGMNIFTGLAKDANRDRVVNDLVNLAAKAQQFYRRPLQMGGGGNSFGDGNTNQLDGQISFDLTAADTANDNGVYAIITDGSEGTINGVNTGRADVGSGTELIIKGWGVETGDDDIYPIQAYVRVGAQNYVVTVVN